MSNVILNKGGILLPNADLSSISVARSAYAGIHTLLSPVGWKPEDETLNIIEKFRKSTLVQKRYIFSISDSETSIPNNTLKFTGYNTYLFETINGEEVMSEWPRNTAIAPTAGSTNRYIIVCGIKGNATYGVAITDYAQWAHFSSFTDGISSKNVNSNPKLQKLTCDAENLGFVDNNFSPAGTGILYFPKTLVQLNYGFRTNNLQAVVCYATVPPTQEGTIGSYTIRCDVFVPDDSVNAYKAAVRWSAAAARIRPLSEFNIDNYND